MKQGISNLAEDAKEEYARQMANSKIEKQNQYAISLTIQWHPLPCLGRRAP